jgi:hypothetical protein
MDALVSGSTMAIENENDHFSLFSGGLRGPRHAQLARVRRVH